ncbi:hypothetical protein AYO21_02595 [Fonsecaea monophora]|uniref:Uncharacterized protein n=1 Tax=Fonsecaea monophora TaxID=254056 RepID=A0A177FJI8_9EURO|nr:hypothetical protein AYO21_02595 [Fonsecaea monophora]KAH0847206.1 hypothetical protein FOPE_00434 [Fonsecaea pedrosoi]OAG43309.1 hypothetical protein AYO21_02595 [Fonsecaea monophora]
MWRSLFKRDKCVNPNPDVDVCEKYVSPFLTTGVPLIIGLCLFAILGVILFIVVRRKRRLQHAQEAEKNREIDDDNGDLELVENTYPRDQAYKHFEAQDSGTTATTGQGLRPQTENPFEADVERGRSRDVSPVGR